MEKEENKVIGASVPPELAKALSEEAKKQDRSVSWVIRKILKDAVTNEKEADQ